MTTLEIASFSGAANLFWGLSTWTPVCIAIGVAMGFALWREYRLNNPADRA